MSKKLCLFTLFVAIGLTGHSQSCPAEDCAAKSNPYSEFAQEIVSPTNTLIEMDFDALTPWNYTVAEINAAYPGTSLGDVTATPGVEVNGFYNFQVTGNALGHPIGGGGLGVIGPLQNYDDIDEMTFHLTSPATEIGFQIGDWSGPFNIFLYDGAIQVGMVQVNTLGAPVHYIQSDTEFDSFELTAEPDFPVANWVVSALYLPQDQSIPTVGEWGLIILGLSLLIIGVITVRGHNPRLIMEKSN